jgi:outer membrane protein insertion porin family
MVDINNVSDTAASVYRNAVGESVTSSMTVGLSRDTRDRGFNATQGSDTSFQVTYAGGPLAGDHHFTRYVADAGFFIPTGKRGYTFFARGKGGYVVENQEDGLPVWEKFFLGGMNSVRGFKWYSISPKDPDTGNRIGGEKMAQFNLEFIFPIVEEEGIMGVLFQDNGQVWEESEAMDLGKLRHSYGVGVRYYSPIGPLRLEYGKIIDREEDEPEDQVEFSVGTFF